MLMCYTAGPLTDKRGSQFVEKNIQAAREVAFLLWGWDYAVVCPHTNTEYSGETHPYELWMKGDFEMIRRCDFIVMLPRYVTSSGAQRELDYALKRGIE